MICSNAHIGKEGLFPTGPKAPYWSENTGGGLPDGPVVDFHVCNAEGDQLIPGQGTSSCTAGMVWPK